MKIKNGFTLFELLVVISIIGILLGLGTVAFSTAQKKARDTRRIEDMQSIQKALEQYYALADGNYPAGCQSGAISFDETTLLSVFPSDPKGGEDYVYDCDSDLTSADGYCYCALLEEETKGNSGASCDFADTTHYCVNQRQ